MPKVYMETYGCTANKSDSEIMSGILEKAGFEITKSSSQADVNIINTCIVKTPTEQRMIHRIQELTKKGKPLIVAGCMTRTESDIIERINLKASLIGTDSIAEIDRVVSAALCGEKSVNTNFSKQPKIGFPKIRSNEVIDIVQIAQGCLSNCSFCQTKFARGKLVSKPINFILEEIRQALSQGCKEIWLTSTDNGCYGMNNGSSLPTLLREIVKINRTFLVRVGMMNPTFLKLIIDDLISVYESDRIFKFIHMPIQSGSDRVLAKMKRGYKKKDCIRILKKLRKEFPSITISTDVIVGFPGETVSDFRRTIEFIKKTRPDIVNLSKFWKRPGTEAAEMEQLPRELVNKRSKELLRVVRKIQIENNKKWLDWQGEILIDEKGKKGGMIGRNFAYKPIVSQGKLGTIKKVEIVDVKPTYLIGK